MKTKTLQWIVMGFFALGFVGLAIPWTFPYFVMLMPLAVIAVLAMLIIGHDAPMNWQFYTSLGVVFLLSYVVELLKVYLFFPSNVYFYGDSFGPLLFRIPLLIGLCWLALLYICAAMAERLKVNVVVKILVASGFMVLFDAALELVACDLDLWYWIYDASIWNYLMWFIVSVVMFTIMKLFGVSIKNKVATTIYVAMIIFLLALTIVL
jgi:putative membrane protein